MKLQEVSAQILTKQSDRASPNSVILTATIIIIIRITIHHPSHERCNPGADFIQNRGVKAEGVS